MVESILTINRFPLVLESPYIERYHKLIDANPQTRLILSWTDFGLSVSLPALIATTLNVTL